MTDEQVIEQFLQANLDEWNRTDMLRYLRVSAAMQYEGAGCSMRDYVELLEHNVPWNLMTDAELREGMKADQKAWLQSVAEEAEKKAGWDPNP